MAGISAQMLKNRKFAGKPDSCGCAAMWYPVGKQTMFFLSAADAYTRHAADHYHMNRNHECNGLRIVNFHPGQESGIGQHEICWQRDREYICSVTAKSSSPLTLTVSFTDRWGNNTYVSAEVLVDSGEWRTYTVLMECPAEDDDGDLRITFSGEGCVRLGAVSLLSADHFHGMRRDVIAALKEMGVKVLRWPGGNFAGEYLERL